MTRFEEFMKELDELPKITTASFHTSEHERAPGDKEIEAMQIIRYADTREEVEQKIMEAVKELIEGKKAWVRLMPVILFAETHEKWIGRARIAVDI